MSSPFRLACLLLFASCAAASPVVGADPDSPEPVDWAERIVAEEGESVRRPVGMTRFGVSHPHQVTARLGTVFSRQPAAYPCTAICDHVGPLVQLDAGNGGAQLGVGYARVIGDRRRETFLLSDVYVGFGVKGALLRTWGDTERRHRDRTFAGVEGEMTIANFNLSLGFFRGVSGEGDDRRWLTTVGLGWGF